MLKEIKQSVSKLLVKKGFKTPLLPQIIRIETTNACNLKCSMCFQSTAKEYPLLSKKKGFMEKDLFKKIVIQISKYKQMKEAPFYLHIGGEPLLHQDIINLVSFSSSYGLKPVLVTNGTMLTEEISEMLIDAGLKKIEFSFEGISKEIYEAVRVGSNYNTVLNNINSFLALNRQKGNPVKTELVVVDLPDVDKRQKKEFIDKMINEFDKVNLSGYFDWLGKVKNSNGIDKSEKYTICSVLDSDLNVLWDGTVVPCCMDVYGEMAIGDFKTMSFEEILFSSERFSLRERLKKEELSGLLCDRCPVPWDARKPTTL